MAQLHLVLSLDGLLQLAVFSGPGRHLRLPSIIASLVFDPVRYQQSCGGNGQVFVWGSPLTNRWATDFATITGVKDTVVERKSRDTVIFMKEQVASRDESRDHVFSEVVQICAGKCPDTRVTIHTVIGDEELPDVSRGYTAPVLPQGMEEVALVGPGTLLTATKPTAPVIVQVDMEGDFIADVQQRNSSEMVSLQDGPGVSGLAKCLLAEGIPVTTEGAVPTYLPVERTGDVSSKPDLGYYCEIASPGDLTSLTWMEKSFPRSSVAVSFAALNFRDPMIATNRLNVHTLPFEGNKQQLKFRAFIGPMCQPIAV
eukprot:sb/3467028/